MSGAIGLPPLSTRLHCMVLKCIIYKVVALKALPPKRQSHRIKLGGGTTKEQRVVPRRMRWGLRPEEVFLRMLLTLMFTLISLSVHKANIFVVFLRSSMLTTNIHLTFFFIFTSPFTHISGPIHHYTSSEPSHMCCFGKICAVNSIALHKPTSFRDTTALHRPVSLQWSYKVWTLQNQNICIWGSWVKITQLCQKILSSPFTLEQIQILLFCLKLHVIICMDCGYR
jgi:hypothetical protein